MTEPNPYEPPAGDLKPRSPARFELLRDIAFTTVVQSVFVIFVAPGDNGRWLSRAFPIVLVGNLGFGGVYWALRPRWERVQGTADLVILMLAGFVIFALIIGATSLGLVS